MRRVELSSNLSVSRPLLKLIVFTHLLYNVLHAWNPRNRKLTLCRILFCCVLQAGLAFMYSALYVVGLFSRMI